MKWGKLLDSTHSRVCGGDHTTLLGIYITRKHSVNIFLVVSGIKSMLAYGLQSACLWGGG